MDATGSAGFLGGRCLVRLLDLQKEEMKVSQHFDARELVPRHIWEQFGENSTWFISDKIVHILEFYKSFWYTYYKKKDDRVKAVLIRVNNWHTGGGKQWSGLRTARCTEGAANSQHRYKSAVDCEIVIQMADGSVTEADYKEVHRVILENEREFMANGVTCIEDPAIATGWLHSDTRWVFDQKHILVVKP